MCLLIANLKLFRRTGQKKAFTKYRIPEPNRSSKLSVDMSIFGTSRHGEKNPMQFIRISNKQ